MATGTTEKMVSLIIRWILIVLASVLYIKMGPLEAHTHTFRYTYMIIQKYVCGYITCMFYVINIILICSSRHLKDIDLFIKNM